MNAWHSRGESTSYIHLTANAVQPCQPRAFPTANILVARLLQTGIHTVKLMAQPYHRCYSVAMIVTNAGPEAECPLPQRSPSLRSSS